MIEKSENDGSDTVATKAMEWCIALQECPDDHTLRSEFEAWLAESDEHARAWEQVAHLSDLIAQSEVGPAVQSELPISKSKIPKHKWRRVLKVGMPVAAAACLLLMILPSLLLRLQADYLTDTGETRRITLSDQSVIELAPESAIQVTYSSERRHVTLLSGHAFFDVRPAAERPFSVAFGGFETRVVGTAFEVRIYDESALVAVSEGVVAVNASSDRLESTTQLTKGQVLRVGGSGKVAPMPVPPDQVGAWRNGRLIVRNRPIDEVIQTLEQYHTGVIVRVGPGLADLRLTGIYDIEEPETVLRAVALAHNLTVRRITPWVLTISRL